MGFQSFCDDLIKLALHYFTEPYGDRAHLCKFILVFLNVCCASVTRTKPAYFTSLNLSSDTSAFSFLAQGLRFNFFYSASSYSFEW